MKRRHVLAVLGLSFVTLGIYVIYWLYKTRKELLGYLPDQKAIPRVIILFAPLLGVIGVAIVVGAISAAFPYGSTAANTVDVVGIILMMLAMLAIFVVAFWWFYRYFKAVEAVTQGNDAMLYYTLWIILTIMGLGPIWVLIVQNDLNKFIENGYRPLKAPGYPAPQQQPWQPPVPQQQYGQPYPQPYPQQPPYPYQQPQQQYAAPQPVYQQPYGQYPNQQPAPVHEPHHHAEHGEHHPHHEQHHAHHQHEHHGHSDQPHDDGQNQQYPPQNQV